MIGINGKKRNLRFNNRGVSTIIGSMLLVAIVTTSMSVLISTTSESNRKALSEESETKQEHLELISEMREFYDLVKNTNTSYIDDATIEPIWYWPEDESIDVPLKPECKVYFDGPKSSVATVFFRYFGLDDSYATESSGPKYRTVEGGTLITFTYDGAVAPGATYYWKVLVFNLGEVVPKELDLSFTTVSS